MRNSWEHFADHAGTIYSSDIRVELQDRIRIKDETPAHDESITKAHEANKKDLKELLVNSLTAMQKDLVVLQAAEGTSFRAIASL
jgi:hypothetical protein